MRGNIVQVKDLNEAKQEIEKINVNPVGVTIMAFKAIHRLVKFKNVDSKTANIIKQEMLSRGGDAAVSRDVASFKGELTDMIIMGTLAQYIRLIRKLKYQPYDCQKVAKEIEELLFRDINISKAPVW